MPDDGDCFKCPVNAAYRIAIDVSDDEDEDDRTVWAPIDHDHCVRLAPLRFEVGTRVSAKVGDHLRCVGEIVGQRDGPRPDWIPADDDFAYVIKVLEH